MICQKRVDCFCQQTYNDRIHSKSIQATIQLEEMSFLEKYTHFSKVTWVLLNICILYTEAKFCKMSD